MNFFHTTEPKNSYRVAIIGHRGVPSTYGGFETFAEKIAESLVGLGSRVVVYCRAHYFATKPSEYKGAQLVYLPSVHRKSLETLLHTLLSVLHVVVRNTADVVLVVNVGNAPSALLARLFGKKVIFCVDGLDWERKKWGGFARLYLRACSYVAKYVAHKIVTDAASVLEFYQTKRNTHSVMIPYGADFESQAETPDVLAQYGLQSKKFFLFMARFEPEYNPLLVVEAYVRSGSTLPLVMVGDNRYDPAFVEKIKQAANDRVLFLGYVFGYKYKALMRSALAYIRAAEVGGFSPAVVEAMGYGTCVVANDKPENLEPLADTGVYFDLRAESLAQALRDIAHDPAKAIALGVQSAQRAMLLYSWDTIGFEYFKLIKEVSIAQKQSFATTSAPGAVTEKKKILITGAGGMLGRAAYEQLRARYHIRATNRTAYESWLRELDVTDPGAFEKEVADFRPDYILHFAALTDLEKCEKQLAETYQVNSQSVKYAAQLATKYGAKLVYASTSGVFDGHQSAYTERDEPHPLTVYGLTKQMGALMAQYYATDYLIIRPSWLMGGGPNHDRKFVGKVVQQIVSGARELHALGDTYGTLTYAADVASVLEQLLAHNATGLYNMAGIGRASRYDIACEIVRILGYEKQITVVPVDENFFKKTYFTHRAPSECLTNERLEREQLPGMRPWQESLRDYLQQQYAGAFKSKPAKYSALPKVAPSH